ncbi:hypothetical protein [Defluviimonas salinarum]|uniref:Uncharacterized protein n=1 Tax=Defluviimonas salinarum TaxID=2992147 RepID=A0ABT3J686_9RHOB|nr:hypothetical protein [Defluviimonas salinarum]MCW3782904.1 hypothetical protein [Defluviimonas salinarum]
MRIKGSSVTLQGAARPVVIHVCWACSGSGHRLASVSPIRFKPCPICNGRCGRTVARPEIAAALAGAPGSA